MESIVSGERARMKITDLGDRRRVELVGRLHTYENGSTSSVVFETPYSEAFLRLVVRSKSIEFLKDEIDREAEPNYLREPMRRLLGRFLDLERLGACDVLDYGCGGAASSVTLARILPRARITGIDVSPNTIEIGRARLRELGMEDRIEIRLTSPDGPLPFEAERFDIVLCDGVLEHIPRRRRAHYLGEIWRVMRRGGHLFIRETPNRLFPFEGHTSRLPFVHWLPLALAGAIVRALSPNKLRACSNANLAEDGFIGVTYSEVLRCIRAGGGVPTDLTRSNPACVDDFFHFWLVREHRPLHRTAKLAIRISFRVLHAAMRPLGTPVAALLPSLDLCIRKDG